MRHRNPTQQCLPARSRWACMGVQAVGRGVGRMCRLPVSTGASLRISPGLSSPPPHGWVTAARGHGLQRWGRVAEADQPLEARGAGGSTRHPGWSATGRTGSAIKRFISTRFVPPRRANAVNRYLAEFEPGVRFYSAPSSRSTPRVPRHHGRIRICCTASGPRMPR